MNNIVLSVVIPSYRDPLLHKTVESLLTHSGLGDSLEIIPVLDGYWPETPIIDDERVRIVHLGKNRGMRRAINAGVSVSRGEFFMRLDEHCDFGDNYDLIMTSQMKENEICTAKRYFLDPTTWKCMDIEPVEHEKLVIQNVSEGVRKFAGIRWRSRDEEQKDVMVSEMTAMQGSMWIAPTKWFRDVVGELQTEGYGPTYQDSVEVCMKTWQKGGRLILNKNTWFAHKHRDFPRTHQEGSPENPSKRESSWAYSLKVWEDYYRKEIVPKWGN